MAKLENPNLEGAVVAVDDEMWGHRDAVLEQGPVHGAAV